MSLEIWIPPSAAEPRRAIVCHCGTEFPVTQQREAQRHAIDCVKRHGDEVQKEAHERDVSGISRPLDSEQWEWGRKRIAEGKVGFKRGRAA